MSEQIDMPEASRTAVQLLTRQEAMGDSNVAFSPDVLFKNFNTHLLDPTQAERRLSVDLVPPRSPGRVHAAAKSRCSATKAGTHWRANMHMTHLMKMVEMRTVMETIDENKAHTRANEKRGPPVPRIGIRIVRDRVHKHAAVRALDDLPSSIALQTRASHDLLHRSVNVRLPRYGTAIGS